MRVQVLPSVVKRVFGGVSVLVPLPSSFISTHTEAYVTLVTNDNYALGALALGRSLRDTLTTRRLSLLITDEVSYPMR